MFWYTLLVRMFAVATVNFQSTSSYGRDNHPILTYKYEPLAVEVKRRG